MFAVSCFLPLLTHRARELGASPSLVGIIGMYGVLNWLNCKEVLSLRTNCTYTYGYLSVDTCTQPQTSGLCKLTPVTCYLGFWKAISNSFGRYQNRQRKFVVIGFIYF